MHDERQKNTTFFERFRLLLDSLSACEIITESGIPSTAPHSPNSKEPQSMQTGSPPVVSNAVVMLCADGRSISPPAAPVLKNRLQLLTTSAPELRRGFSCNDVESSFAPTAAGLYELLLNALRCAGQLELANLLDPGRRLDSAVRLATKASRGGVLLHLRIPELLVNPHASAVPASLRCRFSPEPRPGQNACWLDVASVLNPPSDSKPPAEPIAKKNKMKRRGVLASLLFCCIPRRRDKLSMSQLPHEKKQKPDDLEFVERVCDELRERLTGELRDTLVQHFEQNLKVLVLCLDADDNSGAHSTALPQLTPAPIVQQSPAKAAADLPSGPKCADNAAAATAPLNGAALTATVCCTQREAAQCLVDAVSSGRLALAVERILAPVFSHTSELVAPALKSTNSNAATATATATHSNTTAPALSGVLCARIACAIDEASLEEALALLD